MIDAPFAQSSDFYVSLGFKVMPVAAGSKLPAIKGGRGFKDASDDPDQIDNWARRFPRANIGIATGDVSGIVVVDVDPRNGGTRTLNAFAAKAMVFPRCPEARTGNNGRHLLFQIPQGDLRKALGVGVDIKGNGGYIVVAPSKIASSDAGPGGQYRWVISPRDFPPPQLPRWALDIIVKPLVALPKFKHQYATDVGARSLEGMTKRLASCGQGNRNNLLNWAAYQAAILVREGRIGAHTAETRLTAAALAAGLTLPEIRATIASAAKGAGAMGAGNER